MNTHNKPVVNAKDAVIFKVLGKKHMECIPIDYPEDHMFYSGCVSNEYPVITSEVISVGEDYVETKRTYYKISSWLKKD